MTARRQKRADEPHPLRRAAELVARLRPDWRDASAFYEQRAEVLGLLRAAEAATTASAACTRIIDDLAEHDQAVAFWLRRYRATRSWEAGQRLAEAMVAAVDQRRHAASRKQP